STRPRWHIAFEESLPAQSDHIALIGLGLFAWFLWRIVPLRFHLHIDLGFFRHQTVVDVLGRGCRCRRRSGRSRLHRRRVLLRRRAVYRLLLVDLFVLTGRQRQ